MALIGRIIFLQRIRKDYSSLSDGIFLNCFSYAVYDFLENSTLFYKYSSLYGSDLYQKLLSVANEWQLCEKNLNGHKTKAFLEECLNGKYDFFIRNKLKPFLMPFLYDSVKHTLGKRDTLTYVSEDF